MGVKRVRLSRGALGCSRGGDALDRPPGILTRMTRAARQKAAQQWQLAIDEWALSRSSRRVDPTRPVPAM